VGGTFIQVFQTKLCFAHWLHIIYLSVLFNGAINRYDYLLVAVDEYGELRIKKPTSRTEYSNLFCHKIPHVSGIFCAHHQELSIVHSALVRFMQF
jgi:hypothetical protein